MSYQKCQPTKDISTRTPVSPTGNDTPDPNLLITKFVEDLLKDFSEDLEEFCENLLTNLEEALGVILKAKVTPQQGTISHIQRSEECPNTSTKNILQD